MGIFDGVNEQAKKGINERHPFLAEQDGSTAGEYLLNIQDLATPTGQDGEQFFISKVLVEESTNPLRPAGSLATIIFKKKAHNYHLKEILGFFTAVSGDETQKLTQELLEFSVTPEGKKDIVGTKIKARVAMEQKYNGKTNQFEYNRDGSPTLYPELRLVAVEKNFPPVRMGPPLEAVEAAAPKQSGKRR